MAFKGAATRSADPLLSPESAKTPGLDRLLAELGKLEGWRDKSAFELARSNYEKITLAAPDAAFPDVFKELLEVNQQADVLLERAESAFSMYDPLEIGSTMGKHLGMADVGASFATLARISRATVAANLDALTTFIAPHLDGE